MGTAYECDYCTELVREIYKTDTFEIEHNGRSHKVTVVVGYNGKQGEHCLNCVPVMLDKVVTLMRENGGASGSKNKDEIPDCEGTVHTKRSKSTTRKKSTKTKKEAQA